MKIKELKIMIDTLCQVCPGADVHIEAKPGDSATRPVVSGVVQERGDQRESWKVLVLGSK